MTETTLFVNTDGSVAGLYSEAIDLRELGRLDVQRAALVEFDNARQQWVVTSPDGYELGAFKTKSSALLFEEDFVSNKLERS